MRDVIFASGLQQPYGIAFYPAGASPRWVYIGDTDAVVRFPYRSGALTAQAQATVTSGNQPIYVAVDPTGTAMALGSQ